MTFAVYVRTSKVEQNLENQEFALRKYANSMGWGVVFFGGGDEDGLS